MRGVSQRRTLAIVILVVLFGSAGVVNLIPWNTYESPFQWGVEVGEELLYSIEVSVTESGYPYGDTCRQFLGLDGEQIIVTITELPNVTGPITEETFLSNVILDQKITCRFSNGSAIPQIFIQALKNPISQSLLPIGGWELMDTLFLDVFPSVDWSELDTSRHYVGSRTEERFYFASRELYSIWPNVASEKWEGWSDFDSGIPFEAQYTEVYPACTYQYTLVVNMIYIESL